MCVKCSQNLLGQLVSVTLLLMCFSEFSVFMDTKDDVSDNIERPTVSVKRQLNTIKVTVKYKGNIIRQQHW